MRRLRPAAGSEKTVPFDFEGRELEGREGEPLASALLAAGERVFSRSVKYHRPRGPYCFAAACSSCLMRVDGVPNVYTCQIALREGMKVARQNAFPSASFDVFAATDWIFAKGLDHHSLFAGVPVADQVMAKVARQLAGLGVLPDKAVAPLAPAQNLELDVAIVGGGISGEAAAGVLSGTGCRWGLFEKEAALGGRARLQRDAPFGEAGSGPEVRTRTAAIGIYGDAGGRFLAMVQRTHEVPQLLKVYARKFLLAMGSHPHLPTFENNDLPGIYAAEAMQKLLLRDGLMPGERICLVGSGPELNTLAAELTQRGAEVVAVVDREGRSGTLEGVPVRAHGIAHVTGLTVRARSGEERHFRCDTIGLCGVQVPSFELGRQGGAEVVFDERSSSFGVVVDGDGRTASHDLFVVGTMTGICEPERSRDSGKRAATAIVADLGKERA